MIAADLIRQPFQICKKVIEPSHHKRLPVLNNTLKTPIGRKWTKELSYCLGGPTPGLLTAPAFLLIASICSWTLTFSNWCILAASFVSADPSQPPVATLFLRSNSSAEIGLQNNHVHTWIRTDDWLYTRSKASLPITWGGGAACWRSWAGCGRLKIIECKKLCRKA